MLSNEVKIINGQIRNTYGRGIGIQEEEERLKQLKINRETARRQGDQEAVKEYDREVKELEDEIERGTS